MSFRSPEIFDFFTHGVLNVLQLLLLFMFFVSPCPKKQRHALPSFCRPGTNESWMVGCIWRLVVLDLAWICQIFLSRYVSHLFGKIYAVHIVFVQAYFHRSTFTSSLATRHPIRCEFTQWIPLGFLMFFQCRPNKTMFDNSKTQTPTWGMRKKFWQSGWSLLFTKNIEGERT